MTYNTSIYRALNEAAGNNSRKLGVAYIHAITSKNRKIVSNPAILDEAQNVYGGVSNIGRTTLHSEEGEKRLVDDIEEAFKDSYVSREDTVGKVILELYNKKGIEETIETVGNSLEKLLTHKRDLGRDLKEIDKGKIHQYEQKAIRKELSQYLD
ncbi:hypothetical protein GF361_01155 [Candidatus Woesearchaeota archaeon]|nr:hypothetical protein [Candidatus Woesearchaeota archaeon]